MKVLLPPGMGDQHWIMLKMASIRRELLNGERPEFWVWQPGMTKQRTEGYLTRLSALGDFGGFWDSPRHRHIYKDVFVNGRWTVKHNFEGFRALIGFNAPLEQGVHLNLILPGCKADWNYPLDMTEEEAEVMLQCRQRERPFILAFFCGHGFYEKHWLSKINVSRLLFDLLAAFPEHDIVLTGREWDIEFNAKIKPRERLVNLVGKTDLTKLFAMMRTADAFIGFPAGNGMMAQHLGTPTLLFWTHHFKRQFWTNWVEPAKVDKVYRAVDAANFSINEEVEWLTNAMKRSD